MYTTVHDAIINQIVDMPFIEIQNNLIQNSSPYLPMSPNFLATPLVVNTKLCNFLMK